MEILVVAQFWGVNPNEVRRWPMPFFTDCYEYATIQMDKDPQTGTPRKEVWKGPGSKI